MINVNFLGVIDCVKSVEEFFKNKKSGHISIVSSIFTKLFSQHTVKSFDVVSFSRFSLFIEDNAEARPASYLHTFFVRGNMAKIYNRILFLN